MSALEIVDLGKCGLMDLHLRTMWTSGRVRLYVWNRGVVNLETCGLGCARKRLSAVADRS